MNAYEVIHLIKNMDNFDKIGDIMDERCFTTSVMTPEIKKELAIENQKILKLGESAVYEHVKKSYGL